MTWLADPVTREPLPALPSKERELSYAQKHWQTGWLSGIERAADGTPTRMWFMQCPDECCAEYRANLPPLESLRGRRDPSLADPTDAETHEGAAE